MLDSFKIILIIDSFYKLKLFEIMRIYNVFHFKLLNFIVINSLSDQKNLSFKVIIVKDKKKWIMENILNFKKLRNRFRYKIKWKDVDKDLNWYNIDRDEFDNAKNVIKDFHKRYSDKSR